MDNVKHGNTFWVRVLAFKKGFSRKEFNAILRLQYKTKHTKELTPEQLDNLVLLLKSFPNKKGGE